MSHITRHLSCVMCHVSCGMCYVLCVMCQVSGVMFNFVVVDKLVEVVRGGSVIDCAYAV